MIDEIANLRILGRDACTSDGCALKHGWQKGIAVVSWPAIAHGWIDRNESRQVLIFGTEAKGHPTAHTRSNEID